MKRLLAAAPAFAVVLGLAAMAPAQAATRHHAKASPSLRHASTSRHFSLGFAAAPTRYPRPGRHNSGLVGLVGDRESGLGFHALPPQFRSYRMARRHRPGDAIDYAIAAEMGNYYGVGGYAPYERHAHLMFNPVDGYGTPFFAGYYGPAGDPDEERGPFGNPYTD